MEGNDPVLRYGSDTGAGAVAIAALSVCRIGRDPSSDVVLATVATSRTHAMIRRDMSGACFLSDTGSRNGTLLNGLPISAPVKLADGDTIQIGGEKLIFEQPAAPTPLVEADLGAPTQVFLATSLVTVLVADMRGHTQIARELGDEKIAALLSELFGRLGEMLNQRHCWYQKYIGDAIMALWVHDRAEVDRGTFAAVLDMIPAIQELVAPLQSRFGLREPVRFGIGINSGTASIGNLGSAAVADFTAVGDAVTKAFRLEAATRTIEADVLIGHGSIDMMFPPVAPPPEIDLLTIGLKGYDAPEPAYRLRYADLPLLAAALAASDDPSRRKRPGMVA